MAEVLVRRALQLTTPVDGDRRFVLGEPTDKGEPVRSIEPLPSGAGYEVAVGSKLLRIPEHKVDHYEQDPRPGYEQEQRDGARMLPSFVVPRNDGTFACAKCGVNSKRFRGVHEVKVHHGKVHGGER